MSDYSDILNRKKTSDKLGDAFSKQADSMRPLNVGQRREQALLRGLGVGLNNDDEREAKLAELEEDYKQVDMLNRQLQMSSGKNQLTKAQNENFFLSNRNDLATMNAFLSNGDFEAVDVMAPTLIENYKKITGRDIGEYAYSRNGKIYLENGKGEVKGQYLAEILQGIIPESEQMNFPELLTYNSKQAVQAKMDEQRLKNEQIRAAIEASYASADLSRAKGIEALNKSKNPPMTESQKILFKSNVDNNQQYLKDERKKIITDKALVQTLNDVEEVLIEAAKKGDVGSNAKPIAYRLFGKYISGNNKETTLVDMAKAAYFARVKEAGGSNPSTKEFLTALETIPNTDKNLFASLQVIRKDRKNALQNIYKFNNVEKNLRDREYQGSPDDENIINFNEEELNNFVGENSSKKTVRVFLPKTSKKDEVIIDVPIGEYEDAYNKGFRFYNK